jgi:hypothetical protein
MFNKIISCILYAVGFVLTIHSAYVASWFVFSLSVVVFTIGLIFIYQFFD